MWRNRMLLNSNFGILSTKKTYAFQQNDQDMTKDIEDIFVELNRLKDIETAFNDPNNQNLALDGCKTNLPSIRANIEMAMTNIKNIISSQNNEQPTYED